MQRNVTYEVKERVKKSNMKVSCIRFFSLYLWVSRGFSFSLPTLKTLWLANTICYKYHTIVTGKHHSCLLRICPNPAPSKRTYLAIHQEPESRPPQSIFGHQ